jgi:hypothetical protein
MPAGPEAQLLSTPEYVWRNAWRSDRDRQRAARRAAGSGLTATVTIRDCEEPSEQLASRPRRLTNQNAA